MQAAFPEWELIDQEAADVSGTPGFAKNAKPGLQA
jgi:hypothetical protein